MSEHDEQSAVVSWFKAQYPKHKDCIIAIPNGQMIGGRNKWGLIAKLKKEGFKNGVSDLFIAVPNCVWHGLWIEMKDVKKTKCCVSQEQLEHIELMKEMGYAAIWCAGFEEASRYISAYMVEL